MASFFAWQKTSLLLGITDIPVRFERPFIVKTITALLLFLKLCFGTTAGS